MLLRSVFDIGFAVGARLLPGGPQATPLRGVFYRIFVKIDKCSMRRLSIKLVNKIIYMYIYICIYIEREMCMYIYIYIHIERERYRSPYDVFPAQARRP